MEAKASARPRLDRRPSLPLNALPPESPKPRPRLERRASMPVNVLLPDSPKQRPKCKPLDGLLESPKQSGDTEAKQWARPRYDRRPSLPLNDLLPESPKQRPKLERRGSWCVPLEAPKAKKSEILPQSSASGAVRTLLRKKNSCPDLGNLEVENMEVDPATCKGGGNCLVSNHVNLRRRFWMEARVIYFKACAESPPSSPYYRLKTVWETCRKTVRSLMLRMKVIEAFQSIAKERMEKRLQRLARGVSIDGFSDVSDNEECSEEVSTAVARAPSKKAIDSKIVEIKMQHLKNLLPTVVLTKKALQQLQALAQAHQNSLDGLSSQIHAAKSAVQNMVSRFWHQLKETAEVVALQSPVEAFGEKLAQLCQQLDHPGILSNMHDLQDALHVADEIGDLAEVVEQAMITEMSSLREMSSEVNSGVEQEKHDSDASLSTSISVSQNPDDENGLFFSEASLLTNSSEHSDSSHLQSETTHAPKAMTLSDKEPSLEVQTEQISDTEVDLVPLPEPPELLQSVDEPPESPKKLLECEENAEVHDTMAKECSGEDRPPTCNSETSFGTDTPSSRFQPCPPPDKPKLPVIKTRRASCPSGCAGTASGSGKATQTCVSILRGILHVEAPEDTTSQDKGSDKEIPFTRRASMPTSNALSQASQSARGDRKMSDVSLAWGLEEDREGGDGSPSDWPSDWAPPTKAQSKHSSKSSSSTMHNGTWDAHPAKDPVRGGNYHAAESVCESHSKNPLRKCLPQLHTEGPSPEPPRTPKGQSFSKAFSRRISVTKEGTSSATSGVPQSRRVSLGTTSPKLQVSTKPENLDVPLGSARQGRAKCSASNFASNDNTKLLKPPARRHSDASRFYSH